MKKNLWVKLISVLLIVASMVTCVACASVEDESGSGSGSASGSDLNNGAVNVGVRAEDLTPSQNLTFTLTTDKKGYQLKSVSKCKDEEVVIPASYTGTDGKALPVTAIATGAFKDNKTAVTVYIPDSVTKIAGGTTGAFSGAKSLTKVVCGSGITEIGNRAFENCSQLKVIDLKSGVKKIGNYAFAGCDHLEAIVIPDTVTNIGESCFQRCSRMTSVTLGKGLKSIGDFSFYFCKNISTVRYTGTIKEWNKLNPDVSCFLSVTMTKVAKCSDGEAKLPELSGQNELPAETVKPSKKK